MKKRVLSLLMALCLVVTLLPVTAAAAPVGGTVERIKDTASWYSDATKAFDTRDSYWNDQVTAAPADYAVDASGKTVSIGSPEALVWWSKQVNAGTSFAGYTVNITADLDLSAHYWTPICTGTVSYTADGKYSIANNQTLDGTTINGNGHTITGLATQTGVRGPNQDSKPGDGQNCYYDAAFIGYSCCDITIEGLTFDGARIAISEPFDEVVNTYGSSMVAVIVGAQTGGSLTLKNVTVNDADVLAMQKASAFVGNLMGGSTLTVDQCAITNSRFSAYFMVAPIAAYGKTTQVSVNGIKLENNQIRMVDQTWATYEQDPETGAWYCDGDLNACTTALFYDGSSTTGTGTEWAPVAEVNGYQYDTLAAAIAAVPEGVETTVKLTADCQLDATVVIPEGKIVVLDLNGCAVTVPPAVNGKSLYALDNKGTLTITDSSSAQNGSITARGNYNYGTMYLKAGTLNACDSNGGGAAVWNEGSFEMTGGTLAFIGQKSGNSAGTPINNQAGASATISGGSLESPYTCIFSYGDLEVSNITLSAETGFWDAIKVYGGSEAVLRNVTINASLGGGVEAAGGTVDIYDCTFTQKDYYDWNSMNVAASNGGTVNIHSGSFTSENYGLYIFSSGGTINVYGGKFDAETVLKADNSDDSPSVINVTGGAFTGSFGIANGASLSVTGGYFSHDPSAYVAADQGLAAVEGSYVQDGVSYAYQVTTAPVENVEVKPGATETTVPSADELGITDEQKADLDTAVSGITGSGLSDAGNSVASDEEKLPTADKALEDFNDKLPAGATHADDASDVTVVVVPRLDVTVESYTPDQNKLELDIKAVYDLKATTDSDHMKEKGDEGVADSDVNTVTLQENAGTLDTTGTQVQVTVPLPTGFVSSADESIFVTHVKDSGAKYIYKATVSGNADSGFTASFLNANGFSSFTLTKDTAASITDGSTTTYYETLQEAVNAAANGQTIRLEKNNAESVVVSRAVSFTLDNNGKAFTGSIAAGSGYSMSKVGSTYTFTYVGGGSGGSGSASYTVKVESSVGGSVSSNFSTASSGTTVTLTVKPESGYILGSLTVTDANGNVLTLTKKNDTQYTFTMPARTVTVKATFKSSTMSFTDVPESYWAYDEINWAYTNGYMKGVTSTTFAPDGSISRQQVWMILARLSGADPANMAEAKSWAMANGVSDGSNPGSSITRQQLVTMLYRYAKLMGYDTSKQADLSGYPDSASVAGYAKEAMAWSVANGIVGGTTDGRLNPTGTATRAHFAAISMRFVEKVVK